MPNPIDYLAKGAATSPRRPSGKQLVLIVTAAAILITWLIWSGIQSSRDRASIRESDENARKGARISRSIELGMRDEVQHDLTHDEQAELSELRAREAKEKVDRLGR